MPATKVLKLLLLIMAFIEPLLISKRWYMSPFQEPSRWHDHMDLTLLSYQGNENFPLMHEQLDLLNRYRIRTASSRCGVERPATAL